jgi:hypothetical protein
VRTCVRSFDDILTRRARTALGTATQCTRRNDKATEDGLNGIIDDCGPLFQIASCQIMRLGRWLPGRTTLTHLQLRRPQGDQAARQAHLVGRVDQHPQLGQPLRQPPQEGGVAALTRRARTALGTATQCTRRNDWRGHLSAEISGVHMSASSVDTTRCR